MTANKIVVDTIYFLWPDLIKALTPDQNRILHKVWTILRLLETEADGSDCKYLDSIVSMFRKSERAMLVLLQSPKLRSWDSEDLERLQLRPIEPEQTSKKRVRRGSGGFAAADPPTTQGAGRSSALRYTTVPIYYATNRERGSSDAPQEFYMNARGDGELRFGTALVTIPDDHKMGELETPSIFRLEINPNKDKHVTVSEVHELSKDEFVEGARDALSLDPESQILLFIHGYNVSFEDGARRAGQIAYDLHFRGTTILFSWASANSLLRYGSDAANVIWSRPHLEELLRLLAHEFDYAQINIIAHSMGSRALADVLKDWARVREANPEETFRNVIFAAPDTDAQTFHQLVSEFHRTTGRNTVYSSSRDAALSVSSLLYGSDRAGQALSKPFPIDVIDATNVDHSLLGHSYYGDNRSIISDIFYLVRYGLPPEERSGLKKLEGGSSPVWEFW